MAEIDPYTSIESFRELKALEIEVARARADAVNHKNAEIVDSGTALVRAGMDQWELKAKVWEAVHRHETLLRLAGINTTGLSEKPTGNRKGEFNVRSNAVRMQTGFNAVIALEARGSIRGNGFHDVAEKEGFRTAIQQFIAPDVCIIYIYDQKTRERVTKNCLDPGDFSSYDIDFSEQWGGSSNPFRLLKDFDCEAEKGRYTPSYTLEERPMSQHQLIYGAGLYAVHSAWLGEIEACLSQV